MWLDGGWVVDNAWLLWIVSSNKKHVSLWIVSTNHVIGKSDRSTILSIFKDRPLLIEVMLEIFLLAPIINVNRNIVQKMQFRLNFLLKFNQD